jgi:hypothetical protein
MASLGVWCTLRKQRIWFDSRRDVARVALVWMVVRRASFAILHHETDSKILPATGGYVQ